jgi:hypothetical protein
MAGGQAFDSRCVYGGTPPDICYGALVAAHHLLFKKQRRPIEFDQRLYDMNGIFQMQGGKNRILPK